MNRIARSRTSRRSSGQVIALTALLVPALLGIMGLALDGGMVYQVKRRMQSATDAAAMGGAMEVSRRGAQDVILAAARTDASMNGFTDGSNATTVTVNHPPTSGSKNGNNRFVEVIIARNVPVTFLRFFNRNSATVRSRAVAGMSSTGEGCVIALNPTVNGALTVGGSSSLTAGCGVMVNSNSDSAITLNGGGCVTSSYVGVSGAWNPGGGQNCVTPAPDPQIPPMLDPLAYLTPPNPADYTQRANNGFDMQNGSATLQPGIYRGGIHISGGTATFSPGVYIIDSGDLQINGGATVTGNGVMFYITNISNGGGNGNGSGQWGTITIDGTANVTFSAPDTGPYEGMLFWTDRTMPDRTNLYPTLVGTSTSQFLGAIYSPSTQLNYSGTSASTAWTMLIGDRINVTGTSRVNGDFNATSVVPPTLKATLTE